VAEDLRLPSSLAVYDIAGMGCGAAIPNLECAARLIQAGARQTALSIAVEICSATFFRGPDPDLVVSNSIFGDGAAAAVLQSCPNGTASGLLEFLDFESAILPKHREQLRYRHEGGRLRNVLSKSVPVIGARAIAQATQRLLERHDVGAAEIQWWAVHPGGTAVLERVEQKLNISRAALRFSYDVFRRYGNMSSPSVMFVLDKILRESKPQPGDKGVLLSFGAGFTAFAALVGFC
jgi:alkylresorcinol/alkylpyrone synthase